MLTLEDTRPPNGFGSAVLVIRAAHHSPDHVTRLGLPDRLSPTDAEGQLAEVGLDPAGIARSVRDAVRRRTSPTEVAL